jgi:hypothetical protein
MGHERRIITFNDPSSDQRQPAHAAHSVTA